MKAGHPRWRVVGLSSFLALVVGVVVWAVLSDDAYVAPRPGPGTADVQPSGAATTIGALTHAIVDGRPADAAALAADGDDATAARLASLAENARGVPLDSVDLRYVDEIGGADATGRWSATVAARWRVAGLDPRPTAADVRFDFATDGDRVVIAGVGGRGGTTPVWMSGAVDVRRHRNLTVLAASHAGRFAVLGRRAVRVVRRVLPRWDGALVIEVPRTAAGVDAALDVERGTFRNVAGVTAEADGSRGSSAPVHVFLNPAQMRRLEPVGAQVVVSHEAVHVALDAPGSPVPLWLSEGFADYVALRDVDLPPSRTAAQVLQQVRTRGVPRSLPDDDDFDEQSDRFGASYEAAWWACRLLAQDEGERTLVTLYQRARGGGDFPRVFRATTGRDLRTFTQDWRASLRDLAG